MKLLTYFLVTLLFSFSLLAKTIQVPADVATIQEGINLATNGDTVLVTEGRYYENIDIRNKAIVLASHFILDGKKLHIKRTVIDGSKKHASVLSVRKNKDSISELTGFTITGGLGTINFLPPYTSYGGGIYCVDASVVLRHNFITDNQAKPQFSGWQGFGGGIYAKNSNLIIENCKISSNSTFFGGGVFTEKSDIIFKNNSLHKNEAYMGGGLFSLDILEKGITISSSQISANRAIYVSGTSSGYAGGILVINYSKKQIEIVDNIFNNNISSIAAAGVYCSGLVKIERNLFIKNSVLKNFGFWNGNNPPIYGKGGGVYGYHLGLAIANNTFDNNSAKNGSAIYVKRQIEDIPYPLAILVNNTITNCNGQWGIYSEIDSIIIHSNNVWNNEGGNISCMTSFENMSKDPQYMNPENYNYKLKPTSPCIDAGAASVVIDDDTLFALDESEYFGEAPDMGAFESHYFRFAHNYLNQTADELFSVIKEFKLETNFPNPFNPKTTINYQLPIANYVELAVYNLLGQKITTLVNKEQEAGYYSVTFDASDFASGVYVYKIKAGRFTAVRKMILMK